MFVVHKWNRRQERIDRHTDHDDIKNIGTWYLHIGYFYSINVPKIFQKLVNKRKVSNYLYDLGQDPVHRTKRSGYQMN